MSGEPLHQVNSSTIPILYTYPIDLVLRILELATVDEPIVASKLCLLSKPISRIIRPLLYHTVSLRFLHHGLRFLTTVQTTQCGQMVVNLLLYFDGENPASAGYSLGFEKMLYQKIIPRCPNIQWLLFNPSSPPVPKLVTLHSSQTNVIHWPVPQEISLIVKSNWQEIILESWLNHPLFHNVTHVYLEFWHSVWETHADAFLELRQLTHFCLSLGEYRTVSRTFFHSILETLLNSHDSLKVLMLIFDFEDGHAIMQEEKDIFIRKAKNWEFLLGMKDKNLAGRQDEDWTLGNEWKKHSELQWKGIRMRMDGVGDREVDCIASWRRL